jgi:hypothetical protein
MVEEVGWNLVELLDKLEAREDEARREQQGD